MSEEGWDFVEERELRKSRSSRVCMNCDHLTRRCREWMVRSEIELGWSPEVG